MTAGPCTHYRVQVESAHLFGPLSLVPCSQLWVVGPAWSYKDTRTDLQNCGGPTRLRGTNGAKKTISVRRTLDIMESQNSRAGPVAQKEGQGPPAKLSLTLDQPPCATRDPTIHHYISFAALGETPQYSRRSRYSPPALWRQSVVGGSLLWRPPAGGMRPG